MKRKVVKELNLLGYKRCHHCGLLVKGTDKICPDCGRLLVEDLREISWDELLEAEPECELVPYGLKVRALFETAVEEYETELC